ncbi:MAG: Gfo/Idh/MocA family oxidoreductase [Alphaproteobacteria bacterium]|nr:Gfo/Idh/MocA family oxidoreductase [Alphaproteobacteria bacterium]
MINPSRDSGNKPLTVAVLGAGIGALHLNGYAKLRDRYRVTWLCDLDTARAESLLEKAPDATVTADLAETLADPEVDIIDICLPPLLHLPTALAALEAGKHVILEKPIAPDLAGVAALQAAQEKAGRLVSPVFQYRYGVAMAQWRALSAAGLLGEPQVGSIETYWTRGADYYQVAWRGKKATEIGGVILSHVIHMHDLACEIFGAPIEVSAMLDTRVNAIETEDCAAVQMRIEGGALVSSSTTLGAAGDATHLRFVFEKLTAESGTAPYEPMEGGWTFNARDPADQPGVDAVIAAVETPLSGFAGYLNAFADAVWNRPGGEDAVSLEAGRRSIALAEAIYRADREGRRTSVTADPA